MNLYDRIQPGKRRHGWGGAVFLAAACVVLVICIGTIGWAARYHQRYRRFSTDFAASVENAGKIGAALTRNGETSSLDPDASSRLCRLICAAGAGKVQPGCPQGEPLTVYTFPLFVCCCCSAYHSGAVLDLWEVEIPEETAKNPTGVFVRYTFADGTVYQYDTDQIQMNEVRLALGLH